MNIFSDLEKWHVWFAWYPVTIDGTKYWLRKIYRRGKHIKHREYCEWYAVGYEYSTWEWSYCVNEVELQRQRNEMNIQYNQFDIGGEVVKDNETYLLKDNKTLNNLVLSSTHLHARQSTRGHSHAGQEEVYFFVSGSGTMTVGEQTFDVTAGSVILIPDGLFHRVCNTGDCDLVFNCVFDGKRNH